MHSYKKNFGFTLLELLIVIFILAIISSLGFSAYKTSQYKNQSALAVNLVAFDLRRAQAQAQASDGDSQWGVAIQTGTVIIFKGNSYATRDSSADDISPLPGLVTATGLSEVVFSKMYGLPQSIGTTTLTTKYDTKNIFTNAKGTVLY